MRKLFLILLLGPFLYLYSQVKIEMEKTNGVYYIPCEVNGLKLKFVFDTGASIVSISQITADYMLEHGFLQADDIHDEVSLKQADGSLFTAYKVKLKKISFGGYILEDIDAVITPSQNSPLLLGQTAIQKLGKVSIKDNYLIIENKLVKYSAIEEDIVFLGLKLGTSYGECEEFLIDKYGEKNVLYSTLNGNTNVLEVENEVFIEKKFDLISLYFDKEALMSARASLFFPSRDLAKALRFRDNTYAFLNKKYKATKRIKNSKTNLDSYVLGYKNKQDIDSYPIKIDITKSTITIRHEDDETELLEGYEVEIVYWPAALNKIIKDYVVRDDY